MSRRLTILAGAGTLVAEVAARADEAGDAVQIIPLVERPDLGLPRRYQARDLPAILWKIGSFRSTHVTMIGGLRASAAERDGLLRFARVKAGSSGDGSLLRVAERLVAMTGARLVGVEEIMPEVLVEQGHVAGPVPSRQLTELARYALDRARAVGALDLGQAVIVSEGRVISVEDIAGTDALLKRVGGYRAEGLTGTLVLAKTLKPGQSRAVDRPAVGPETLRQAHAAGIAAIALEAGGAIIIDRADFVRLAGEFGICVLGL
jgi:UDP-2,3-diacylglucosamine hydrolase